MSRRVAVGTAVVVLSMSVAGCRAGSEPVSASPSRTPTPTASTDGAHDGHSNAVPEGNRPLREGERLKRIAMPAAYTPSAPYGAGTDDYRCFVLDPELDEDAFITGLDVLPGTRDVVHHVILFRVPPEHVDTVQEQDDTDPGQGWTCFGGTGLESTGALDDAPWLGAWAPGGGEQVMADDVGVPLDEGSRVIMQVHYNLLAGPRPDVTSAQLRLAPATKKLAALETMLLPAPVELPCRPAHDEGPLCDRAAAVDDVRDRFGYQAGGTADYLHLLCGRIKAGSTQTCDTTIERPATLRAVAGHMHLLGKSIKLEVNPGRAGARTVLDVTSWDFDNQGSKPTEPLALRTGDTVRVTCRHDQRIRDVLPAFEGQQERYVVWGEGTTDEMCLGILLVTHP